MTSASNSQVKSPKDMGLLVDNNNKKGNNFHVKIIFMVILSLSWKPQNVPLPIMGLLPDPVQQQAGRSQEMPMANTSWHLRVPRASRTQTLAPWWKHSSHFPGKSALGGGFQRESSGHEQGWQEVTPLNQQVTSKATSMHHQQRFQEKSNSLGSYRRDEFIKTYILPKHLKSKYWLIQSCFEWSYPQCITLLWV